VELQRAIDHFEPHVSRPSVWPWRKGALQTRRHRSSTQPHWGLRDKRRSTIRPGGLFEDDGGASRRERTSSLMQIPPNPNATACRNVGTGRFRLRPMHAQTASCARTQRRTPASGTRAALWSTRNSSALSAVQISPLIAGRSRAYASELFATVVRAAVGRKPLLKTIKVDRPRPPPGRKAIEHSGVAPAKSLVSREGRR
jgi:hypothetical protein